MEGQQLRGAEGGREEYHDIPNDSGTPGKFKTGKVRQELPILFRASANRWNEVPGRELHRNGYSEKD